MVVRSTGPLVATVGDELVMLIPDRGEYFGLDAIGARVWGLLDAPRSVAEVRALITAEYEVDDDTCEADTRSFLQELASVGLIEVRE